MPCILHWIVFLWQGFFRDATDASPQSAEAWYHLGLAKMANGKLRAAHKNFFNSVQLKAQEPILPFDNIPFMIWGSHGKGFRIMEIPSWRVGLKMSEWTKTAVLPRGFQRDPYLQTDLIDNCIKRCCDYRYLWKFKRPFLEALQHTGVILLQVSQLNTRRSS